MKNKLSIIITGRNDNYYKDFLKKTSFNLNYILKSLHDLKLQKYIDIIFIDWGSKTKLSKSLTIEKKFKNSIKFYHVSNKISSKESDHTRRINTSKAHNLGVRLSKSNYCLLSHSDQIFPKYSLRNIYNLINGKIINSSSLNSNYFYIPRKYLDNNFFNKFPSEYLVDRYFEHINFVAHKWKNPGFLIGAGWGGILIKKKIFGKLNGLKEDYYLGIKEGQISPDLDFHQRAMTEIGALDGSAFGIAAYRFTNNKGDNRKNFLVKRKFPDVTTNYLNINWGLRNYKPQLNLIRSSKKQKTYEYISKINFVEYFNFCKEIASQKTNEIYGLKDSHSDLRLFLIFFLLFKDNVFSYSELGNFDDNIFYILAKIFRGHEFYKFELIEKSDQKNILFKILNELKRERVGNTKCMYLDSKKISIIFNNLPKEKLSNFLRLNVKLISHNKIKNFIEVNKNIKYLILDNINQTNNINIINVKGFHLLQTNKKFSFYINQNVKSNILKFFFGNLKTSKIVFFNFFHFIIVNFVRLIYQFKN